MSAMLKPRPNPATIACQKARKEAFDKAHARTMKNYHGVFAKLAKR